MRGRDDPPVPLRAVDMPYAKPATLQDVKNSSWRSKTVKREIYDHFGRADSGRRKAVPRLGGYDDTVIPEVNLSLLAGHDMLFLGEKGQAKSRLMRLLVGLLNEELPYLDLPGGPVHEDPLRPPAAGGQELRRRPQRRSNPHRLAGRGSSATRSASPPAPKFADVIGEIDPAKLAAGASMSTEEALHFGLIPRMHRGIFAMNELPELDELVQVGLFNILEERDVQIRGYPVQFDIDVMLLFSATRRPTTAAARSFRR